MEQLFYLQDKRQYVGNDILWWARDGKGYTTDISKAHVFTKEKALSQHRCRPDIDIPWPKDYVDSKTRPAVDMQCVDIEIALQNTGIDLIEPPKSKRESYNCHECGRFVNEEEYYTRIYAGHPCRKCEE